MTLTDPIADFISRIKNAVRLGKESIDIPSSKVKESIAHLLKEKSYISHVEVLSKGARKTLRLSMKFIGKRKSAITDIVRVSRPGRRIYVGATKIPRVQSGYGVCVVSTPKGIMDDVSARKANVGGEILCRVW
jgi:small subunit ribosomal protein S8